MNAKYFHAGIARWIADLESKGRVQSHDIGNRKVSKHRLHI